MPNNAQRREEALNSLERELKARDRKEKTRPLGVVAASLVVILALVGGIYFFATRDNSEEKVVAEDSSTAATPSQDETPEATALSGKRKEALPASVRCKYEDDGRDDNGAKAPSGKDISTKGTVQVTFKTNQGDIAMDLDRSIAPCTVQAITSLAKSGFYDGTICHRMTSGGLNVLQCGDPTGTGSGGPGFSFANEYPTDEVDSSAGQQPVTYPKGSIAMANSGKDTNGSQFFINYADSMLTPDYTYFGNLTDEGQKTLDKIAEIGVEGGSTDGKPAEEIKISKATVSS